MTFDLFSATSVLGLAMPSCGASLVILGVVRMLLQMVNFKGYISLLLVLDFCRKNSLMSAVRDLGAVHLPIVGYLYRYLTLVLKRLVYRFVSLVWCHGAS